MAFDSFGAFLAMEGHGPYVWASYGVFFVLMAVLMVGSYRRRNAVLQKLPSARRFPLVAGAKTRFGHGGSGQLHPC
ncbi:MAG: heme exporter protein CcmD [Marinobacter sp.]|nr:heme exporter protein CcmD [Marinobacter sp.]